MKKIFVTLAFALMLVAVIGTAMATEIQTTWQGSGSALITMTAPHVSTTVDTNAGSFNGYQNFNLVDITETRVSRMSQFSGGGYISTTDFLTDSNMDNTWLQTYAQSGSTGQVSIADLGWSGNQLYASFNDDRYGLPYPQTPTFGQSRGLSEHFNSIASGSGAIAGVALGNSVRGVSASATGNSASADGRASFGFNWANVESAYSISGLTLTSS